MKLIFYLINNRLFYASDVYIYIATFTIEYAFLSRESGQICQRDLLTFPLWVFGCKFPRLQHFLHALINQSV